MVQYFRCEGVSMDPACHPGDFVLTTSLSYMLSQPKIGDVVVVSHPHKAKLKLLKRIQGVKYVGEKILYWVEGDNPQESQDSRIFGWLSRKAILGKAKVIHRDRG